MTRLLKTGFGLATYAFFLIVILYAIGFTGGIAVPKAIDDGASGPLLEVVLIDLALLTLFAVQHSVMARPGFKRQWTKIVSPVIERSVYVLLASLILTLLFWQWRPLPDVVWAVDGIGGTVVTILFWIGWGLVFLSTFLISHFELFGVRQVLADWTGTSLPHATFKTPLLYRYIRHPLYLGFIIAFWAAPTMTLGHLLFAAVTTAYILVAIQLEERDLLHAFGDSYAKYRTRAGMLFPSGFTTARSREDSAPGRNSLLP